MCVCVCVHIIFTNVLHLTNIESWLASADVGVFIMSLRPLELEKRVNPLEAEIDLNYQEDMGEI